jgi:hypothetical protein
MSLHARKAPGETVQHTDWRKGGYLEGQIERQGEIAGERERETIATGHV